MENLTHNKLTNHQATVYKALNSKIESILESKILMSYNVSDYMLSLMGAAGTGKTYLTTEIVKFLKNSKIDFTITAPTHKAVNVLARSLEKNNVEAPCKTIHSFLGIKPFKDYDTGIEKFVIDKATKQDQRTTVLIVDESSMIGDELYGYIAEKIKENKISCVLFVGDPYQLLPISGDNHQIYRLKYQYELQEIVRQAKDSSIIKMSTQIRDMIARKTFIDLKKFIELNQYADITYFHNDKDFLEDFYKNERWFEEDKIIATYKNKDVDALNKIVRNKYWEQKNVSFSDTLRAGDKLRFVDAYSAREITIYHNGQIVELEYAQKEYHEALNIQYWDCKAVNAMQQQVFRVVDPASMSKFNDKLKALSEIAKRAPQAEKSKLWYTFFTTRDMFANVQYIHASTIHKLQGSTYESCYVDIFQLIDNPYMSIEEKYRLFYVAITRASKNLKLFVSDFNKANTLSNTLTVKKMQLDLQQIHQEVDDMLEGIFK
ncbi:AAA family ATPase [bacterium]|nr:AAA family ATPase [bacterium]MBU1994113.1 AAA family ATPase [bacterium]